MSANALRLRLSLLAVSRTESELRKNAPCEVSHASLGVRRKRKNTNKVRAYLFVVRSTQNKWCCRTSCFALDTACPICLLCPLRTISANAVRLQFSLLAVCRDLLISDCYRRSIACNGRCPSQQCKHCCLQIVRFAGGVQVRCPQKKKKHEQSSCLSFCGAVTET